MGTDLKKILLLQLFSNGDCLYATTVARQIKNDFPGCILTWAIADFCKNIISGNPYVDEVMVIGDVPKNDVQAFRRLKKRFANEKAAGKWDEVFVTTNMDNNQALYDGTIRGMVFRAYPFPITVPVQPVLQLTEQEIYHVAAFARKNKLTDYKNVILWEYAPQSGQSVLNIDLVMSTAQQITTLTDTCVVLTSAHSFASTEKIIDASSLTVRENAALTHHCSLLIGCSSGITWLNTSSAAKFIPMVQLLNPDTAFLNAPSEDFKRYGITDVGLLEMIHFDQEKIFNCIKTIFERDFSQAKLIYNEILPLQFNTTRKIVYNMLCYLQFGAIIKHCRIITNVYGVKPLFVKQLIIAIITFPFKLLANTYRKKMLIKG